MNFSKLKQLLTGIPSDPKAAEEMAASNRKGLETQLSALEARRTGRAMNPDEQAANQDLDKMLDSAAAVAGMTGKMPRADAKSLIQSIQNKLGAGERLSAAEQMMVSQARKAAGTAKPGEVPVVQAIGERVVSTPVNSLPAAPMDPALGMLSRELLRRQKPGK